MAQGGSSEPASDGQATKVEAASTGSHTITTSSLDALQNPDSRKVMDIVDRLRRGGLSGILQLPQLVVSGDQSSGKSSVLEAITEIPFPRKENLCTRFATEIILRRAATASISTKIIPDKIRPSTEKKRLEGFKSSIVDFSELPNLIEEATNRMGLGDDGTGPARAFSRDVLSIEIAGPGRPHLTLVDLPGLIHSENKMQSKEDVELIRGLVDDYIKEKRTIIMAVVSAKNDYANQIILKKCRDVDPKGSRTLGIITKPDFLEPGSENEATWVELADNKDIFFELGRYRDLAQENLGIVSLRSRLSKLLYKHLKTELPSLQKELNDKHREVCHELELLGEERSTPAEQRRFLMGVSTAYQDIVKAAVNGQYEDSFFGDLDPNEAIYSQENLRRLRAVVQYLNLQFASAMRQHGHKTHVEISEDTLQLLGKEQYPEVELDEGYAEFAAYQETLSRDDAAERVRNILVRSRGRELPGTFNPLLISQLFWQQSQNWEMIAQYHIEQVAGFCANLARTATDFVVTSDIAGRLQSMKLDAALRKCLNGAKAELSRLIKDTKHHPITYDPAYTGIVQKLREKKHTSKLNELVSNAQTVVYNSDGQPEQYLQPSVIMSGIGSIMEPDMDKASAQDALDSQLAYYKEEVKYFISAVTKQVIERYLLRDLAADTISPLIIGDMSDDEVAFVAAEPEETTRERNHLQARKATLEAGQETFRSALRLFR